MSSTQPLVTIVTPSYNQAPYLEWTLRSVLAQDYPHIEYIVVDGGSTDGSVDIIRRYAQRLAWWVSEPDHGQADAINKGFARAQGSIFGWVNSDDMLAPGAVRQAVKALMRHPEAGMVVGEALFIDPVGRPFYHYVSNARTLEDLLFFRILPQPAVFFRREVFEAIGGLDIRYHYLLDHHLWIRMALARPWVNRSAIWAFARFHTQAKNVAHGQHFARETRWLLQWMQEDPRLVPFFRRYHRRILAAGYRYMARYLLDAGLAGQALKHYFKAWWMHPREAATESHRLLFAVLSLMGLGFLGPWYLRWKRRGIPRAARERGWYNVHRLYNQAVLV